MTRSRRPTLAPSAALTVLCAVLLTGCSDSDGEAGAAAPPSTAGGPSAASPSASAQDVDRYCGTLAEVNATAEELSADLPEDAPGSEVQLRWQQLLDRAAPQLTEMEEVAPEEIAADVPVFLADLRARAETGQSPDSGTAEAAEQRMRAFEEQHCPGGPDGS